VRVDDPSGAVEALSQAGIESTRDADLVRVRLPAVEAGRVTRALAERGIYLTELRPETVSLEAVFLELTAGPVPSPVAPPPPPPHRNGD